jgi:hypothetical protein
LYDKIITRKGVEFHEKDFISMFLHGSGDDIDDASTAGGNGCADGA